MRPREFKKVVSSRLATDGAGVKIDRLAGGSQPKVTLPKNAGGDDEFDQSA